MTDYDSGHANITGLALRLAHTISGSAPGILKITRLVMDRRNRASSTTRWISR